MLRRTVSRCLVTSCPATLAVPEVGSARVHRILIVVDLPAPFGPRKPNVSPPATSKSMPRTASTSPYLFVSSLTEMAGITLACPLQPRRHLRRGYGTAPAGCRRGSCPPGRPGRQSPPRGPDGPPP